MFRVYGPVQSITSQERAQAIEQRIIGLGGRHEVGIQSIHAEHCGPWTEILAGGNRITGVTKSDAGAVEEPRSKCQQTTIPDAYLPGRYKSSVCEVRAANGTEPHTKRNEASVTVTAPQWLLHISEGRSLPTPC